MAFSLTRVQLLRGDKTVTRRLGWRDLKVGELVQAVTKAQGLKKGESPERLMRIEVVSVRREPLDAITAAEVALEGFAGRDPEWFIDHFLRAHGKKPDARDVDVTRIEFRRVRPVYLPPPPRGPGLMATDAQRRHFDDMLAQTPPPGGPEEST
jgi:hypothetical protein